jgi:ankyrin repeat protein
VYEKGKNRFKEENAAMLKRILVLMAVFIVGQNLEACRFYSPGVTRIILKKTYLIPKYCLERTQIDRLKEILKKIPDIDAQDGDERTALMRAAEIGHREVVKTLCDEGADVDLGDKLGYTALHMAARYGSLGAAEELLFAKANINAITYHGWTPLFTAVHSQHPDIVELFIKFNANIDYPSFGGITPLSQARKNSNPKIEKLLLEAVSRRKNLIDETEEPLGFL